MAVSLAPLADLLTGYLLASGRLAEGAMGSPSQIFRSLTLSVGVVASIPVLSRSHPWLVLLLAFAGFSEALSFFAFHRSQSFLFFGISWISRFTYLLLIVLHTRVHVARWESARIFTIYLVGMGFVALNVIGSGTLGFGRGAYGSGGAVKGFVASGNALGLILSAGGLCLVLMSEETRSTLSRKLSFMIWASCLLVGTKGVLVFFSIGVLTYITRFARNKSPSWVFVSSALILSGFGYVVLRTSYFDAIFQRFTEWGGSLTYFLGHRDVYVAEALTVFQSLRLSDAEFMFRSLFGAGAFVSFRSATGPLLEFDTLESDAADVFFMYGMFGLLLYTCFWGSALGSALRVKNKSYAVPIAMFAIYSFLAGHSMFNGLVASCIGVTLGFVLGLRDRERPRA